MNMPNVLLFFNNPHLKGQSRGVMAIAAIALAGLVCLSGLTGCGPESEPKPDPNAEVKQKLRVSTPEETVEGVWEAMLAGDADTVWEYMHISLRETTSRDDFFREIQDVPDDTDPERVMSVRALDVAGNESVASVSIKMTYANGETEVLNEDFSTTIHLTFLVFEDGRWWIASQYEGGFNWSLFTAKNAGSRFLGALAHGDSLAASAFIAPDEINPDLSEKLRNIAETAAPTTVLSSTMRAGPYFRFVRERKISETLMIVTYDVIPYTVRETSDTTNHRQLSLAMKQVEGLWYVDVDRLILRGEDLAIAGGNSSALHLVRPRPEAGASSVEETVARLWQGKRYVFPQVDPSNAERLVVDRDLFIQLNLGMSYHEVRSLLGAEGLKGTQPAPVRRHPYLEAPATDGHNTRRPSDEDLAISDPDREVQALPTLARPLIWSRRADYHDGEEVYKWANPDSSHIIAIFHSDELVEVLQSGILR